MLGLDLFFFFLVGVFYFSLFLCLGCVSFHVVFVFRLF